MSAWKEYQVTGNRESLDEYRRECNEDDKMDLSDYYTEIEEDEGEEYDV